MFFILNTFFIGSSSDTLLKFESYYFDEEASLEDLETKTNK